MFHLSEPDRRTAKLTALVTLKDNANRIHADRTESRDVRQKAAMALMAIELADDLASEVGYRHLRRLLRSMMNDVSTRTNTNYSAIWPYALRANLYRPNASSGSRGIGR